MKYILTILTIVCVSSLHAQDDSVWMEASKESQAWHEYRMKTTNPPFGLTKIKALISKISVDENDTEALDAKTYQALSFREKFTYHMIHAESYSQNCDAMPPIQEEHKKIFGELPDAFFEYSWSQRQLSFLKNNRDSVMKLIKESVGRTKRVGLNYKKAIVEINAKEMIPFIITTYKEGKKDLDLLTVVMLLMKESKYEPFIKSASYRKLYGDEFNYMAYLDFNKANEELIIKRAMDFYNETKK